MKRPGDILITLAVTCTAALSCAKESAESIQYSDIPVSFSAFGSWDEATKTAADGSSTIFTAGDRIGVFAYHNDSTSPDFMNDQPVQFDGTSWSYSPIKYWPAAQDHRLSFYAYWPYREASRGCISIDGNGGAPTLTYSNPDADIDLMAATAEGLTADSQTSAKPVSLNFRHMLAKVRFSFTNTGNTKHVIHALRYNIPYIGIYKFSVPVSWESISEGTHELQRLTKKVEGEIINKTTFIDEFTSFILPCSLSKFDISINNVFVSYTPKEKIEIKAGHQYTINFGLNDDSSVFIISYSIWETDETIHEGKLQ